MQNMGQRSWSARVFVSMALAVMAAGCTLDSKLALGAARGSVAFESIDGPPPGVFQKLVQTLNDEAQARRLAVVSRQDTSQYRVRGYLAAHVAKGRTSIAWVWDVYDAKEQRTLRIAGQEEGGKAGRDAWTSADDKLLQRIARSGMDQLAAFLNGTAPEPDAPADDQATLVVAEAGP
jgi:hypothetical protein